METDRSDPHYVGEVEVRWLKQQGPDRDMELLSDFAFYDSEAREWPASAGEVVDGASIPDKLWSKWIGTPFIGDYRRASVVHDLACAHEYHTSRDAHRMFYEAMREDGVQKARALVMYAAVRMFGPKWGHGIARDAVDPDEISFDELERALDAVVARAVGRAL